MNFAKNRWVCLIAAMLIAVLIGVMYSWSVYVKPLSAKYGWSTAAISMAYSINVLFMMVTPLFCGRLRAALGLRKYITLGAVCYGAGIILCSFIQSSVYELYLYYGFLVGAGQGIVYLALISHVVLLFPDKKGLAAGLYAASFGCASFFWAPLALYLTQVNNDVGNAFLYLGVFFLVMLLITTRFIYEIPSEAKAPAARENAKRSAAQAAPAKDKTPKEVLLSKQFYMILAVLFCAKVGCVVALSLGSPILQETLYYSPERAAFIVGLFAISGTFGRLFWGWMSDLLGRIPVFCFLVFACGVCMLVLAETRNEILFIAALLALPMWYGAYTSIMPPTMLESFGAKHLSINNNLQMLGGATASVIAPQIAAHVRASTGAYDDTFLYSAYAAGVGLIIALLYAWMRKTGRFA